MAMDPNRWTLKTQEAFNAAISRAAADNNPEVTPDHLLAALLGQAEGIVLPILEKVGAVAGVVAQQGRGRPGPPSQVLRVRGPAVASAEPGRRGGRRQPRRAATTSTCPPSTCCWPCRTSWVSPGRSAGRAPDGSRQPPGHQPEPRGAVPGAREVRPRPHRGRPARASSIRSSAATRRSAGPSRSSAAAPRTTRC